MTCDLCGAPLTRKEVTYSIELDGRWIVVEHVPAKVCPQCGEKMFSPDTVKRLQHTMWSKRVPTKILETPVFDYTTTS